MRLTGSKFIDRPEALRTDVYKTGNGVIDRTGPRI